MFSPLVTQHQLLKSNENVKYIPTSKGCHSNNTEIDESKEAVADSGVMNDMSRNKALFKKIIQSKSRKYMTLGDETTTLLIKDIDL